MVQSKIIIVGPRSVGKSTVATLLAKKLHMTYLSSDDIMQERLKEHGGLDSVIKSKNTALIYKEGVKVIEEVLDKDNFIFDLAGGSITSEEVGAKVRKLISKGFVIGLIPDVDDTKSIEFLFNRERQRSHFKEKTDQELRDKVKKNYLEIVPYLRKIADILVVTNDKTPEKIVQEIITKINS